MHFVTLATVEIPHIEENEELNAKIAAAAKRQEKQARTALLAAIYRRKSLPKRTGFSRAVGKALAAVMEPFSLNTEDSKYLEFDDCTDEVEEAYHSDTRTCVRYPDGRVIPADSYEFCSKFTLEKGIVREHGVGRLHHPKRTHKAKRMTLLKDYPVRKLYSSMKDYAEQEDYYYNKEENRFGYMENPNGQWDWYTIGGRWSNVLLVDSRCKEYSLGECDRVPPAAPEGYMWVSAARKKDIAWEAMRTWRKTEAIKEYEMLKQVFTTKTKPDDMSCSIWNGGVLGPSGREYLSGDTQESFLERYGIDDSDPCYPDCFDYYISGGEWLSWDEAYEKNDEDHQERYSAMDMFIDSLSDDTVLVVVDCHI